jgi:phosphatidylserine decarboxylase
MPISPSLVAATYLRALPRKRLSWALGRIARVEAPDPIVRAALRVYCRVYGVELSDYVVPPGGFATFDDFFTRKIRPGSRPIDPDPAALLSPADGRLEDLGRIEERSRLTVKGRPYDVAELLGDPGARSEFAGGSYAIVYLSPRDYHRVHAPISGEVTALRHIGGTLFPVNSIGLRHVPNLFARNERVVCHQRSERHGRVVSILVGAIGVGRISVSFDDSVLTNSGRQDGLRVYADNPPWLERGQELGMFHLGSTVIVLVAPGTNLELIADRGQQVRMGSAIARLRAAGDA